MKPKDAEELMNLIGASVIEVRVDLEDEEDYGFELVFDNGLCLEVNIYEDEEELKCGWTLRKEED